LGRSAKSCATRLAVPTGRLSTSSTKVCGGPEGDTDAPRHHGLLPVNHQHPGAIRPKATGQPPAQGRVAQLSAQPPALVNPMPSWFAPSVEPSLPTSCPGKPVGPYRQLPDCPSGCYARVQSVGRTERTVTMSNSTSADRLREATYTSDFISHMSFTSDLADCMAIAGSRQRSSASVMRLKDSLRRSAT
jgi:hypothetical protein